MRVDRGDQGVELPGEPAVRQRLAIAVGRDGEAGRHRQPGASSAPREAFLPPSTGASASW